jgi:hypothetical protein
MTPPSALSRRCRQKSSNFVAPVRSPSRGWELTKFRELTRALVNTLRREKVLYLGDRRSGERLRREWIVGNNPFELALR